MNILFASYDFRYIQDIVALLKQQPGFKVKLDHWTGHDSHQEKQSKILLEWADVIIAEWCLGNAVWYSKHKKAHQKLIIRYHRFEVTTPFPGRVNVANVDQVISVSPIFKAELETKMNLPQHKSIVIPNTIELITLDQPKEPGATFNIGLLGYYRRLKRPDLALSILEALKKKDDRFTLSFKGWDPRETWVWKEKSERRYFQELFQRIDSSPHKGSVFFEPYGNDVSAWFRKIGFILSLSDVESFHLAAAEGMASGSIPLFTGWKGAQLIYPEEFIKKDIDEIVEGILFYTNNLKTYKQKQNEVKRYSYEHFDLTRVFDRWLRLIKSNSKPLKLSDDRLLPSTEVLNKIKEAADNKKPFSFIRIGDGENIVLAQDSVWNMETVFKQLWVKRANKGEKGVSFPNIKLRDQTVESIRKANLVGILPENDKRILAEEYLKRSLTNQIFSRYSLQPPFLCDAYLSREFPQMKQFWEILRGKRIFLISKWAKPLKEILEKAPYHMTVSLTYRFSHNNQMDEALDFIVKKSKDFDVALISCGVNAAVLTQKTAELTGKVAIDFGKSSQLMVEGKVGLKEDKDGPKVTVVIPTYNREHLISKAIDSIKSQTLQNWKIIVMDDASTDGTPRLVGKYMEEDSRIRYFRMPQNSGISHVLNQALQLVDTKYMVQVDSDDWLEKQALEKLLNAMEKEPETTALAYGNLIWWRSSTQKQVKKSRSYKKWQRHEMLNKLRGDCPRFYRTSCLRRVGGWDADDAYGGRHQEDFRMMCKLIDHYDLLWIDEDLYNANRYTEERLTKAENKYKYNEIKKNTIEKKLKDWGNQFTPEFYYENGWIFVKLKPVNNIDGK